MEGKGPFVVCDMLIEDNGKLLMGKRGVEVFGKGTWALPGGHVEYNETTKECLKRELMEETGITPTKYKLIGIINDIANLPGQETQNIRFIYHITEFSGEIKNMEPKRCEGWEWFEKDSLPEPLFVGHIKVLEFFEGKGDRFVIEK